MTYKSFLCPICHHLLIIYGTPHDKVIIRTADKMMEHSGKHILSMTEDLQREKEKLLTEEYFMNMMR